MRLFSLWPRFGQELSLLYHFVITIAAFMLIVAILQAERNQSGCEPLSRNMVCPLANSLLHASMLFVEVLVDVLAVVEKPTKLRTVCSG